MLTDCDTNDLQNGYTCTLYGKHTPLPHQQFSEYMMTIDQKMWKKRVRERKLRPKYATACDVLRGYVYKSTVKGIDDWGGIRSAYARVCEIVCAELRRWKCGERERKEREKRERESGALQIQCEGEKH